MTFIPQFQPEVLDSYIQDVSAQMKSGWVGPGKKTEEFEKRISEISGAKYVVATTSGTMAIVMALESLNLPKGSTILFPDYTFLAGANAAKFMGYNVQLVDIKEDTLCMNPDEVYIKENVSAVMFVNHNGYVGEDVKKIREICNKTNIPMIEDSSQGLCIENAGRIGDVGIFSFSVPKIITCGSGGCLITDNEDIYIKAKRVRDHGDNWRENRIHNYLGVNLKFNDILAAYGLSQLDNIENIKSKKKQIFDWYEDRISIYRYGLPFTWMVIHKSKNASSVIDCLKAEGIQATKYHRAIHENPVYSTCEPFPVAERMAQELVYLPSSLNLEESMVEKICEIIKKAEQ